VILELCCCHFFFLFAFFSSSFFFFFPLTYYYYHSFLRWFSSSFCFSVSFCSLRYTSDMELEDAIHTALLTLKDGYDGKMTEETIEVGVIDSVTKTFRVLSTSEVKDYLNEVE
jgi:20S proteasome subunit alpha 2